MPTNDEHPEKALSPIVVTDDGIVTCFNDLHPLKAESSISIKFSESVSSTNDEHS